MSNVQKNVRRQSLPPADTLLFDSYCILSPEMFYSQRCVIVFLFVFHINDRHSASLLPNSKVFLKQIELEIEEKFDNINGACLQTMD